MSHGWFQVNRPLTMKKDGIQTRKRKPKNPSIGGFSQNSSSKEKGNNNNNKSARYTMYNIILLLYNISIIYVDTYLCGNDFCFTFFGEKYVVCIWGRLSGSEWHDPRAWDLWPYQPVCQYCSVCIREYEVKCTKSWKWCTADKEICLTISWRR